MKKTICLALILLVNYNFTKPLICLFTDLDGNLRGLTIPENEIENVLKKGTTVDGSVDYVSLNAVTINFCGAFSGKAYFN